MDKEQEIKLQFLDEATDYIISIESGVLGLSKKCNLDDLNGILRAAHSIKGGAAMMNYHILSELAHTLEDCFKVIRANQGKTVNSTLEQLLLKSCDHLRQCINLYRSGCLEIETTWLEHTVKPTFEELHQLLGDPNPDVPAKLTSDETPEDMIALLFETEVEGCLQRLDSLLHKRDRILLKEEYLLAAQELGGLGEMLDLKAFTSLCQSIQHHLETSEAEAIPLIAEAALKAWQRSQALVIISQTENIPTTLDPLPITSDIEISGGTVSLPVFDEIEIFEDEDLSFLGNELIQSDPTESSIITLVTSEAASLTPSKVELLSQDKTEQGENTIRVNLRQIEQLSDIVGELTLSRNGLNLQISTLRTLINLLNQRVKTLSQSNSNLRTIYDRDEHPYGEVKSQPPPPPQGGKSKVPRFAAARLHKSQKEIEKSGSQINALFDQLEMDRYSDIHLIFQELMETIVQIEEVTEDIDLKLEDTHKTSRNLVRTSQLLQNKVTQIRMRPFSDLVSQFPRAVREMELKYNKQVQLKIKGSGILIDRSILEMLKDPLLHLLRNAFDHGIEEPETRRKKGKPPHGTIELSAGYRGNQTVITIRDDGAGINLDKIRAAAINFGLDPEEVARASQNDLLNLIFEPGFTTTSQVTDLSGRGVGMDIVRVSVQQVRGQIQVDTQPGQGTTIMITVPFTLSVVRVLLVESGGMMLAFPSHAVEEMLVLDPSMVLTSAGQTYLNWDNFMLPLIELQKGLHFSRPYKKPPNNDLIPTIDQPVVLIIAQGTHGSATLTNHLSGLQVDSYWGEQEVTIRSIDGPLKLPKGFVGCTILGDGRVVPLVDPNALLREMVGERSRTIEHPTSGKQRLHTEPKPSRLPYTPTTGGIVMVVDDSINVRRFLALTLEKANYQVIQAKDGQEALEKLQEGHPIAGIICDIEMPRLDGYGFLAHVKSDPLLNRLPVLMLTSRSGAKHRQIALNLGADGYFSKPFQEQELLQTLKQLTVNSKQLTNNRKLKTED